MNQPESASITTADKIRWRFSDFKWWLKLNVHHRLIRALGGVPADYTCNLVAHAKREMQIAWPVPEEMQGEMQQCILDVIAVFSAQGHSGFSAGYANACIKPLLNFGLLTPLNGDDTEWCEPFDFDGTQQNKRHSAVFRQADGQAYYLEGKVFREPSGVCYTSIDSRVFITEWPYMPTTDYVDVPAQGGEV